MMIRSATRADILALSELYAEFHDFHVQRLPDQLRSPEPGEVDPTEFERKVEEILAGEDAAMLVAESDGLIVGFAEAYVREASGNPYRHARRYGLLQSLGVTERLRHSGLGRTLVDAVEEWARSRGATEMRVETWEFEGGPLPFYQRLGYRTYERKLIRPLTG